MALKGAPAPDYRGLPVDVRHYALAAESEADLDAWRNRLATADIDYWEEGHGEQTSVYFPDPDGVVIEITWPPSRVPPIARPDAMATARRWLGEPQPA